MRRGCQTSNLNLMWHLRLHTLRGRELQDLEASDGALGLPDPSLELFKLFKVACCQSTLCASWSGQTISGLAITYSSHFRKICL